jgi:two-component system sensor histidine kinase UhpB
MMATPRPALAHLRRALPRGLPRRWTALRPRSTFEKVIVANSAIILLDTMAGWWLTQHNPETYHYLIDTSFIALAAMVGLLINFVLLRAAFAPLHAVLKTIHAVERGEWSARAEAREANADALVLARAFNTMLDRLERERLEAAARILRAQEEERRRLALELHDETGQSLTALTLRAAAIAQCLAREDPTTLSQARQHTERLSELAERTLAEVQALSRQLRPPLLDDLGLPAALRWLAEDASERLHTSVRVQIADQRPAIPARAAPPAINGGEISETIGTRLPREVETALFRIAQESVTNAVRHGNARQVRLILRLSASYAILTIADTGDGCEAERLSESAAWTSRGMGLAGMRERARLLGGSLAVRSRPGRGCLVRARVPLAPTSVER